MSSPASITPAIFPLCALHPTQTPHQEQYAAALKTRAADESAALDLSFAMGCAAGSTARRNLGVVMIVLNQVLNAGS